MPSNYTPNYNLNQWEAGDRVVHTDFNADNAKIDAALAKKADTSALNSLSKTVDGKADKSALDAKADSSTLSAWVNRIISLDQNALRATCGSYTGSGTYGETNAKTLTFPSLPYLLIVREESAGYDGLFLVRGVTRCSCTTGSVGPGTFVTVTWNSRANQVSWYGETDRSQMNTSGKTYYYAAIC